MIKKYLVLLFLLLTTFSYGKNYNLSLVIDSSSIKYVEAIKKETKSIFSSNDKININTILCEEDCVKYINKKINALYLLNTAKQFKKKKNSYILSYNFISSIYDENRIIRTSALSIYEYLKENKSKSIYIKNKIFSKLDTIKSDELKNEKILNLKEVFLLANKNNLEIKQNKNSLKLDFLDIDEVKSSYKPKVDIFSNYIQIDNDRAKYSNGVNSQGTLESGVKLTQLIYSNKVIQNIKIKKLLSTSTKNEIKALNDEIMYKSTLIYLNIIKAKKYNQIIKIKHDFISQNLEFAKQRVTIGVQDRSDVYRWQSELSNVNIELANSKKDLNLLKIQLANLLRIDRNFSFIEYGMNSKLFKLLNKDAINFIGNTKIQKSFTNEIVHTHSRLKQILQLQRAKNEELGMNKDSKYLPTLSLEGSAKKILKRYGEGEDFARPWNDEEYQAVINLNLPLYEGGNKNTRIQKNEIELINLKLQYNNVKNLIIENVQKNYESLSSSYAKIDFSKSSLLSSKKNYELIQDKYKNGKENIISLLDAQNAFIVSKLNLNISIIEYLSDLSSIYFFSGKIDILVDDNKKSEVEQKISQVLKGNEK